MDNKNKIDDRMISDLVRSVRYRVPETVEAKVAAALHKKKHKKKKAARAPRTGRPFLWYPVSAALAMLIIVSVFIFRPFMKNGIDSPAAPAPITEIKTELELADKNIKIIWVQKENFKLRR